MTADFLYLHFQGDYLSLMREYCGDRLPRFSAVQRAMLTDVHANCCFHLYFRVTTRV
jgi:hypothetical protein